MSACKVSGDSDCNEICFCEGGVPGGCPLDWCPEPPPGLRADSTDEEVAALAEREQAAMLREWPGATDEDGTMVEILTGWRDHMATNPDWDK